MHGPFGYRRQAVGDGALAVVVGMNAQRRIDIGLDRAHDLGQLARQGAAVGVAEDQALGACFLRRLERLDGVLGVGLVTIEEVFGVKQGFAPLGHDMGHGIADGVEVFFQRDAKGFGHVVIVTFAN